MKDNPSYYGILPANVRYDKRLKPMARIMYTEITALSSKWGYCTANNGYFAKLYEVSPTTVSRWFSQLTKYGYVKIEIDESKGNERKIYPNDQNVNTYVQKEQEGIDKKSKRGIDKKSKNNNTSINTTSIIDTDFEKFWNLYDYKVGRKKCEAKWKRLNADEKTAIFDHVPRYVKSTPDDQYRKHPLTYLNGGHWEDEIKLRKEGAEEKPRAGFVLPADFVAARFKMRAQ